MDQQPSGKVIEGLLEELASKQLLHRRDAARLVREQKITDERILEVLKNMAARDPSGRVRKEAVATLKAQGIDPPPLDSELVRKRRDTWVGVGVFFGVNLVLFVLSFAWSLVSDSISGGLSRLTGFNMSGVFTTLNLLMGLMPYVINVGLLIYFARKRSQVALGMLLGFAISLGIVICLGLIFTVACFVILIGSGSTQ